MSNSYMKREGIMKLLIVSADPRLTLGYSKVIQQIANYLATKELEIVMYTLNFRENSVLPSTYIDPRIKLLPVSDPQSYGFDNFRSVVDKECPDYVFIYGPTNIIYNYISLLDKSMKVCVYLDICQKWSELHTLQKLKNRVTHWFTFLKCWSDHLVNDLKIDSKRVSIVEHGVNFNEFEPVDTKQAKDTMGFGKFLVLNMNRNSIRKNWAVTISGFVEFISRHEYNPDIQLYISCGADKKRCDNHCDIEAHVYTEFFKRGLEYMNYTKNFIINDHPLRLTKEKLNLLYSASDVGINTCYSEGFGLCSVEHAYFNKPQLVTDIPTFRNTLGDQAIYMKPSTITEYTGNSELNGERAVLDYMTVADALDQCYNNHVKPIRRRVFDTKEIVFNRFNWLNIHKQIDHVVNILKDGPL